MRVQPTRHLCQLPAAGQVPRRQCGRRSCQLGCSASAVRFGCTQQRRGVVWAGCQGKAVGREGFVGLAEGGLQCGQLCGGVLTQREGRSVPLVCIQRPCKRLFL